MKQKIRPLEIQEPFKSSLLERKEFDEQYAGSKITKWDRYFHEKSNLEPNFSGKKLSKHPESSRMLSPIESKQESDERNIFNFTKERGEDLFNEIVSSVDIEREAQKKIKYAVNSFLVDVNNMYKNLLSQQPNKKFAKEMNQTIEDLERRNSSQRHSLSSLYEKIKGFDAKLRGFETEDKFFMQTYHSQAKLETDLLAQLRANIISVSNQIKRNFEQSERTLKLLGLVFKTKPQELVPIGEVLRTCKVLDQLVESAVTNNQKMEKVITKLFQKQLSNTIEFKGLCENVKYELDIRNQLGFTENATAKPIPVFETNPLHRDTPSNFKSKRELVHLSTPDKIELDLARFKTMCSVTPLGGTPLPLKSSRSKNAEFQFPKDQKEKLMFKLGLAEKQKHNTRPETERSQSQKTNNLNSHQASDYQKNTKDYGFPLDLQLKQAKSSMIQRAVVPDLSSTPSNLFEETFEELNLDLDRFGIQTFPKRDLFNDKFRAKTHREKAISSKYDNNFALDFTESDESIFLTKKKEAQVSENGNHQNNVLRQRLQSTKQQLRKVASDKQLIIEELSGLRNDLRGTHSRGLSASKRTGRENEIIINTEKKSKTAKTSPASKQYSKKLFAGAKELFSQTPGVNRERNASSMPTTKKNNYFTMTENPPKKLSAGGEAADTNKLRARERESQNSKSESITFNLLDVAAKGNSSEYSDLQRRFNDLEKEKVLLIETLSTQAKQTTEGNLQLEGENRLLSEKVSSYSQQMNELKSSYDKAVFEIQHLTSKLENLTAQSSFNLDKEKLENQQLRAQCEENQILLSSMKLLLKQKDEFVEKLQEEMRTLQDNFEEERAFLLESEKNLKNKISALQNTHHESLLKYQLLEDTLKETASENTLEREKTKAELVKAENSLNELRRKLEGFERTNAGVEQQNADLRVRIDLLTKENMQLQLDAKEKDNFIEKLQKNLENDQNEIEKIREALTSLKVERDLLIEVNAQVRKEIQEHKSEKAKYSTIEEETSRRINELTDDKNRLEEICKIQETKMEQQKKIALNIEVQLSQEISNRLGLEKKYIEEVEGLKAQLSKTSNSETDLAAAKNQVEISLVAEYVKQQEALLTEVNSLSEEKIKLQERLSIEENKLIVHREEVDKQISQLKIDLEKNLNIIKQQEISNQRANEALQKATQRIQELEKQAEGENTENKKAQEFVSELKSQNAKLLQEVENLTDLHNKIETSKTPLANEVQELTKSKNELSFKIQEAQNQSLMLETENKRLTKLNEEKSIEIVGLNEKLEAYKIQTQGLFDENSELKTRIQDYQKQKGIDDTLLSRSNIFFSENTRIKQELTKIQGEQSSNLESVKVLEEMKQTLESKNLLLLTENQRLKEDVAQLNNQYGLIRTKNQELIESKSTFEDQSNKARSELESNVQHYKELLSTKVNDILTTGNNMTSYASKAKHLIEQLQNLTDKSSNNRILLEELHGKLEAPSSPTSSISSLNPVKSNDRQKEEEELSDWVAVDDNEKNALKEPDSGTLHAHDVGNRILSLEAKLKQANQEVQDLKLETESKDSTIELLKDSLKARMVKHQEQLTEVRNECEKVKADLQQRCQAIEASLKDQVMQIIQDISRYKKFGLSKRDMEDVRNIFVEARKLIIQTLEENVTLSAKKTSHIAQPSESALDQQRKEIANAYFELEKQRNHVVKLEDVVKKLTEEKQQAQKAITQANRIKSYLSPIKEEQLVQIINKDPFIKRLATNLIFIKDAMIYHHFLCEILSVESQVSIPWAEKKDAASVEDLEEEARVLKQKLAVKNEELAAQAKIWSSVVSKLDQRLRALIKMAKLEETYETEVLKLSNGSQKSGDGLEISADRAFADRLAIKMNILQEFIQEMLALKDQNASLTHKVEFLSKNSSFAQTNLAGDLKNTQVEKTKDSPLKQLAIPNLIKAISFGDPLIFAEETKEPINENNQQQKIKAENNSKNIELSNSGSSLSPVLSNSQDDSPRKQRIGRNKSQPGVLPVKAEEPVKVEEPKQSSNTQGRPPLLLTDSWKNSESTPQNFEGNMDAVAHLESQNAKLQEDMNKIAHLYEQERFINDQLSIQLQDDQNAAEQMKMQEALLRKQIGDLKDKLKIASMNSYEKEHVKKMFVKFLDSMLENQKGALDVLKVMMSMLGYEQEERDKFFERLKSMGKKSMFAKLL